MRKKLVRSILALSISAMATTAIAQPAIPKDYVETAGWSVGWTVGLSDLWGDVGTQNLMDHYVNDKYWSKPCFMGGMFGRYQAHPVLAARFGINYGTLYANDNWNINKAEKASSIEDDAFQRYLRNQDAKTNVWEGYLMLEFSPLRFNSESRMAQRRMQPVLMAGVGAFHFKPFGSLTDPNTGNTKWVYTGDLQLEGSQPVTAIDQPGRYRFWQVCVPVGAGLRWDIGDNLAFGVDYLYRFTTTDMLDNVSSSYPTDNYFDRKLAPEKAAVAKQIVDKMWEIEPSVERKPWAQRGNKEVLDGYSTISVTFIYKINQNKKPWW
jgi:hypothetical protein